MSDDWLTTPAGLLADLRQRKSIVLAMFAQQELEEARSYTHHLVEGNGAVRKTNGSKHKTDHVVPETS